MGPPIITTCFNQCSLDGHLSTPPLSFPSQRRHLSKNNHSPSHSSHALGIPFSSHMSASTIPQIRHPQRKTPPSESNRISRYTAKPEPLITIAEQQPAKKKAAIRSRTYLITKHRTYEVALPNACCTLSSTKPHNSCSALISLTGDMFSFYRNSSLLCHRKDCTATRVIASSSPIDQERFRRSTTLFAPRPGRARVCTVLQISLEIIINKTP